MMGGFWIWPVLILIGLILLGYAGFRLGRNRGRGTGPATDVSPALRILDDRYARGEIDEDEYRRRRAVLR